jgi:hypothetical protein
MVFLGLILRFIISKEGKIPHPKKVQAIMNMPYLAIHNKLRILIAWFNFIDVSSRTLPLSWHQSLS